MSVFKICEQAIGLVRGKRLILSDSEKSLLENLNYEGLTAAHAQDEAVVCALHFERVRDKLLMLYPWKFARTVYSGVTAGTNNATGWKYIIDLPVGCVSVLGVLDKDNGGALTEYEEITGHVYTNAKNPAIIYTSKSIVTTISNWPPIFSDAFIAYLGASIAPAVTGDVSIVEYCTKLGQQAINEARQLGLISSELTNTLQDELKARALNLARGQRGISPTSEAAITAGLDSAGRSNYRGQLEEQACIRAYDSVRDRLLELYPWSFARRDKTYTFKEASISGWDYSHDLPADCVKVLSLFSGVRPLDYDISDGMIYANAERATLYYTGKITDANEWPGIFRDVFCYELAAEIITASSGDLQSSQVLTEKAKLLIREAERTGAIQYETRRTLKQEIQRRAIILSRGQRSLTGTGNGAAEQGIDIAGLPNVRTSEEMNACLMAWESVRDRLLQLYPWVFARNVYELINVERPVNKGWGYCFPLPSGCVKVLSVTRDESPLDYEEADGKIFVNQAYATLRYTAKITDVEKWPGSFRDVYSYTLAQEIILATTHNLEAVQVLEQKAQSLIQEAIKIGAIRYDFKRPASEEIFNRAISLVRGQRTPLPSGDAAIQSDIAGDLNFREREALAVCKRSVNELRDRLLKMYGWKFARKTATLSSAQKISGWEYAYKIPDDSMKILCVLSGNEPIEYEESDGLILCNASGNITARYTKSITDLNSLDAIFREVLCYELAQEISQALTWNAESISLLEQKKQSLIQNAYRTGIIIEETQIPLKEELYKRAINLVRGQRTIKTTSDAAQSGGLDNSGIYNARGLSEIQACNLAAPKIRDRLLQLYPWTFARKSAELKNILQVSGWEYGYELPEDCLTVLTALSGGEAVDFEISGGVLYSNGANITARYTSRISDMSKWPALFCDAFVYGLASEIALSTLGATEIISVLEQKLSGIIQDAYKVGQIKTEPRIPAKHQLYNRAIGLVKGLRTGSADVLDTRYEDEISACARSFESVRDKLLQLYDWVFARKTDTPARLSESVPGWRYTFALQGDCLKVVSVIAHDRRADYELERGCMGASEFGENVELVDYETAGYELYCNREAVYVRYTARIEDTSKWAAAFTEAFVVKLAEEVALNVVEDKRIVQILEEKFTQIINDAKQNRLIRNDTGLQKQRDSRRKNVREIPFLDYSGIQTRACSPIDYCGRGYGKNANEFCYW